MAETKKQDDGTLLSGELARLAGVSTDTLRHYERMGLLMRPHRTVSGYRLYPPEALARVRMVRQAVAVGFSLSELSGFLSLRSRGGAPCKDVRALAGVKLRELDQHLAKLRGVRDRLRILLKTWDARLAATPRGQQAGLLETLTSTNTVKKSIKGAHQ